MTKLVSESYNKDDETVKHIRPAAFRRHQYWDDIFFLNTLEPKQEQLYFARVSKQDGNLLLLCAYEKSRDLFGDATSMFNEEYLTELATFLLGQTAFAASPFHQNSG
ncbi:hypothetical protein [Bacillus sp. UMB0893]|uniref:hypothetical protein n=1 Tax=Bacillus sp. UMB0893 TaxID=2066053 RepID=UPI000C794069|nr:hypothetical protein [Bacillus sp. UMB0893]PLR69348.1 hypothetical protein CYJ36_02545 [Bacillus sp. UMB0893]